MASSFNADIASEDDVNTVPLKHGSKYMDEISQVVLFHKQKLESCEEEIAQWKRFIKDYNVLQEKLKTYPDKTSHEVMVPIGSLAYMKGKAIHTNEILVHLGESWFAERSCKNALEIIERRKKVCIENLEKAEEISKIHRGWLSQTEEMAAEKEKLIDIVEHISEEEYLQTKKKHKGKEIQGTGKSNLEEETRIFEKFLRLDDLEEQERLRGEMEIEDSESDATEEEDESGSSSSSSEGESKSAPVHSSPSVRGKEKLTRRVSWADQVPDTTQDDFDITPTPTPTTLRIKYRSRQKSLPSNLLRDETELYLPLETQGGTNEEIKTLEEEVIDVDKSPAEGISPQTPSDLYNMINALTVSVDVPQPKSILKKKSSDSEDIVDPFCLAESEKGVGFVDEYPCINYVPKSPDDHLIENPPLSESPREMKKLKPAFSYKVVAKGEVSDEEDAQPVAEEPKKMSRFKAARMKNKSD